MHFNTAFLSVCFCLFLSVHRHKCEECGKAFKIQKQLINHLRLHEEHRAKTGDRDQRVQSMSHPNGARYEGGPSQLQAMRMGDPKIQNPPVNTNYGQPQDFKKPYAGARAQQVDDGSGRRLCLRSVRTYLPSCWQSGQS